MSISFNPYIQTPEGWRFPTGFDSDECPNFANGNAEAVLDDLGFGSETMWDAGPVPINLFEQAVMLARTGLDGKLSPAREGRVLPGPGATVIECGRWEGRDNERLEQLTALVAAARAAGATHIGWG
jgi:hypothetical protein